MTASALAPILSEKRMVVCVGPGGVGKTTVAAALALHAAVQGRRALVCTIDPAKRLASALGVDELGNVEKRIAPERLASVGLSPRGELFAMMLDLKRTWDEFILRNAPADRRDAILKSRFYQQLSTALAGSQEYVAMEKLVELRERDAYDLIILDTPPTAHALDFLDAPNRVLDFLGNEKMRWMLAPALKAGRAGLHMVNLTGGYVVKTLSRLTGFGVLEELAEFLALLAPMYDLFKERAAKVKELLSSRETSFVLVTSPSPLAIDEVAYFHTLLVQDDMPVGAVVANRVHRDPLGGTPVADGQLDALVELLEGAPVAGGAPARERLKGAIEDTAAVARIDERAVHGLAERCAPTPVVEAPRFDRDVYDLGSLAELARHLLAWGSSRSRV